MKARNGLGITLLGFVLTLGVLAPATRASELDQATRLTFDQSVQIPGDVVLPAGTYWFVLPENVSDHNVVRVFDANWQLITTTIAASTERPRPTDDTMLMLAERSAGQPDVLLKWYYPGRTIGHEFVYSGQEGRTLSEETVDTVAVIARPAPTASGSLNASTKF